jgi:hypothetical protein
MNSGRKKNQPAEHVCQARNRAENNKLNEINAHKRKML